jgi:transitional endoplasmic reticulum ATPase
MKLNYALRDTGWLLLVIALVGLLTGWALSWPLTTAYGMKFSEPFGPAFGPSKLWWMILPAIALSADLVCALVFRRSIFYEGIAPILLFGSGVLLFWLYVHDGNALLEPAMYFTVALSAASVLDWYSQNEGTLFVLSTHPERVAAASYLPTYSPTNHQAYEYPAVRPRYTFADVDGMESLKTELLAFGHEALVTDKAATRIRHKEPVKTFRNGALLFGDPGNGKTFMAETLAGSLGVGFISATFAEFASMWVNQTTERVVRVFDDAAAQAPCVLFLDEIDSILIDRGRTSQAEAESAKTTNAVLTRIVSLRGKGVVIMAATNHLQRLDRAGQREGRFDLKIEIPAPDLAARLGILRRNLPETIRVGEDVLETAARHFAGFSVVRLMAIARSARDSAGRDPSGLSFNALLACLRKVQGVTHANLREGVPALTEITLKPSARDGLARLAAMMTDIGGTEAKGGVIQPGAVFYGPPGTGKTLTAKALAKATGWAFIPTTGQDLVRQDDAMDKVIAQASDQRPAIVFIDEADDILADRNYSPHTKMATNKLLTLLDGSGGRIPDVLFIAATNNPQVLDDASRRRFPIKIEFALPGTREIEGYVRQWQRTVRLPIEFSVDAAVEMLDGMSIADIRVTLQEAVNIAVTERTRAPRRPIRLGDLARGRRSLYFEEDQ